MESPFPEGRDLGMGERGHIFIFLHTPELGNELRNVKQSNKV